MNARSLRYLLSLATCLSLALAALAQNDAHIGYIYPAGAQRGSVVEVTVGGRNLRDIERSYITGQGVKIEVLSHAGNVKRKLQAYLRDISKLYRQGNQEGTDFAALQEQARQIKEVKQGNRVQEVPDAPYFHAIPELSLADFHAVQRKFSSIERIQSNNEINEIAVLRITIDADASLGERELRLSAKRGLTNPIRFHIGASQEKLESEPNDESCKQSFSAASPIVINGQILPGDVDRFRFQAAKGQKLVIEAKARELIPYLADAVPGWFQATLSLRNAQGEEIAYVDDYQFRPDPVILFEVPETDVYEIAIRDSIYRGREDFVYRLAIGETPFITSLFPLVAKADQESQAQVEGWNLPANAIRLDSAPQGPAIRSGVLRTQDAISNRVHYAVSASPSASETEPNNDLSASQRIGYPTSLNGRIDAPGDRDLFKISGTKGEHFTASIQARQLGSPLDSQLALLDAAGNVIASNDDAPHPNTGLNTHHADSRLEITLPDDGDYYLQLTDAQNQGGPSFAYQLALQKPEPDFELRVSPSGIKLLPGCSQTIILHAIRKNGFDGPISIGIRKPDLGFQIAGALIPAGKDCVSATLTAPPKDESRRLNKLSFIGIARHGDQNIVRAAIPSEAMTQAFITEHLVDAQQFIAEVSGKPLPQPYYATSRKEPLDIAKSGATEVRINKPNTNQPFRGSFELELSKSTTGLAIDRIEERNGSFIVSLKCESENVAITDGNLIFDLYVSFENRNQDKDKKKKPFRRHFGVIPAIPYRIVDTPKA